jgi:hypothetical protein
MFLTNSYSSHVKRLLFDHEIREEIISSRKICEELNFGKHVRHFVEVGSDSGPTGRVLRVSGRVQDPDPRPWTRHLFGSGYYGQTMLKFPPKNL